MTDTRTSAAPLGALSEEFESGGRGPGAVSSGQGDPGGVSYGIWQLSSRAGTATAFMLSEGAPWLSDFAGARPGSPAFSAAWKKVAARDPAAFATAQHAFIERTHYRPVVAAVHKSTGLDLDSRHQAVRDATWSVAVQHGGAASILSAAVNAVRSLGRADGEYDRALVNAIYDQRSSYVLKVAAQQGLNTAAGKQLVGITKQRYPAERAEALGMFA